MSYPPAGQDPNAQPQYPSYPDQQGLPPYQQPGYQQAYPSQPGYQQAYPTQPGYQQGGYQAYPQQPYGAPGGYYQAPQGVSTSTPWAWINAALPLLALVSVFLMPWEEFFRATGAAPFDPSGPREFFEKSGGQIAAFYGLNFAIYAIAVVTAALDHAQLRKRGIDRPFHWAWSFLGAYVVYGIGRAVVIRRRGGAGWGGPLTVMIVTVAISWVGSSIWTITQFPWEIFEYGPY